MSAAASYEDTTVRVADSKVTSRTRNSFGLAGRGKGEASPDPASGPGLLANGEPADQEDVYLTDS